MPSGHGRAVPAPQHRRRRELQVRAVSSLYDFQTIPLHVQPSLSRAEVQFNKRLSHSLLHVEPSLPCAGAQSKRNPYGPSLYIAENPFASSAKKAVRFTHILCCLWTGFSARGASAIANSGKRTMRCVPISIFPLHFVKQLHGLNVGICYHHQGYAIRRAFYVARELLQA